MGCDIHAHIETVDNGYATHFAEIYLGRNYALFELMAGVRGDRDNAIVPPRGFPDNANSTTEDKFYQEISDEENGSRYISSERAKEYLEKGYIKQHPKHEWKVTNSDLHTPSYLNTKELKQVRKKLREQYGHQGQNYYLDACIAAMKKLNNARLVFWFDN